MDHGGVESSSRAPRSGSSTPKTRKNDHQGAAEVFERAVRFGFAFEALKALLEKDRMAPNKILMRAATITKSCPFGQLLFTLWISWMQQRVDLFPFSHTAIKYDEHFVIDCANSGHYFRHQGFVARGEQLGSHGGFAFNPEAPWRKEMRYKFFTDALLEELVPAVALCDNNAETEVVAATGLLAIADDASVASKLGSSAASASDSKETTQSSPAPSARPSSVRAAEQTDGVIVPLVSIPGVKKNLTPQKQMASEDAHGGRATHLMGLDCVGRGKAAHCVQTYRSASESFVGSARALYVVGHSLCHFNFREFCHTILSSL